MLRFPESLQSLLPSHRTALLRTGVELVLVLLLASQAARLVWLLAVPSGPIGDLPAASGSRAGPVPPLALSFDPFHPGASSAPATADASGYRLHGVRTAGETGSAILSAGDDAQAAFQVGDEVAPGVTLAAVGAGHAILSTGAGEQRLELDTTAATIAARPASPSGTLPTAGPAPAPAGGAAVDPKALLAEAGLRARAEGGYTLIPRGGGQLLRQAGLQAGDVLMAVDGNQLTPERLADLESELASRDEVRLTVQRDGQPRTLTLRTTSP